MNDALAFTIELPDGKYASVNRIQRGWTDPRKSDIYRAVYDAVLDAARREILRVGWDKAECECSVSIIRIVNRRMRVDAGNLSKVELDAMTEAGVWTDDRLATPVNLQVRYDEDGVNRVVIIVTKLYDPLNVRVVARAMGARQGRDAKRLDGEATTARSRMDAPEKRTYTGGSIPRGMALIDGQIVPESEALAEIQKHIQRSRRAS